MSVNKPNPSNADILRAIAEMNKNMDDKFHTKFEEVETAIAGISGRVEVLEREVLERRNVMSNTNRRTETSAPEAVMMTRRDYWRARKTVECGPFDIKERGTELEVFKTFLQGPLGFDQTETEWMEIETVRVIAKRRGGKDTKFLRVVCTDISDRDQIFSRISKLQMYPNLRMEMSIPPHLMGLFRKFERVGFSLRKTGMKTLVRFDDENETIQLMMKEKTQGSSWSVWEEESDFHVERSSQ